MRAWAQVILQVVLAGERVGDNEAGQRWSMHFYVRATAFGGFVLAICMMHSFRSVVMEQVRAHQVLNEAMQRGASEEQKMMEEINRATREIRDRRPSQIHANTVIRRSSFINEMNRKQLDAIQEEAHTQRRVRIWSAYNAFNALLWQVNATSILMVGVGMKLAVHDPLGTSFEDGSSQQRFALGVPITCTFAIQLFYRCVMKNGHHYSRAQLAAHPGHMLVVACRVALLGCSFISCALPLRPVDFVLLQAGMAVLQATLLHVQKHKFPISSDREHPLEKPIARAFDALRLKALRYRERMRALDSSRDGRLSRDSRESPSSNRSQSPAAQQREGSERERDSSGPRPKKPPRRDRWMRSSKEAIGAPAAEQTEPITWVAPLTPATLEEMDLDP